MPSHGAGAPRPDPSDSVHRPADDDSSRQAFGDLLRGWGSTVTGETEGADDHDVVFVRVAWIDPPPP